MRFYATEEDMKMISGIADSIFGILVEVPGSIDALPRPELEDIRIRLFVEESRVKDVVYDTDEMHDGDSLQK